VKCNCKYTKRTTGGECEIGGRGKRGKTLESSAVGFHMFWLSLREKGGGKQTSTQGGRIGRLRFRHARKSLNKSKVQLMFTGEEGILRNGSEFLGTSRK